ncbi:MAG: HAMP domain-containing protein [Candidatus Aminicenantes bacterium]|nr:MAG: HAMP domain-containing protein [Candidatus Aminicenantes bacterium]
MLHVIVLLTVLVLLIFFVIELRERDAIFEEQKSKGVLIAKNIAQLNLQPLIQWDEEGIQRNIEEQVNGEVVYVIFYNRFNNLFVATPFIRDYEENYRYGRLGEDADRETFLFEKKDLLDRDTGQILRVLEIEVPIFAGDSPSRWGSIMIGLSLEEMRAEIRQTRFWLVVIHGIGLLVGIGGAILLARRIANPLKRLAEGTEKISKGDFYHKIPITSQDEIGNLAQSFNEMSHQLLLTRERMEEAHRKLIQAEKLASIGRLAAGIAHEIRNPLTSVKLNIQKLLQSNRLDKIEEEHLGLSQKGITQMEKFVKELLSFTRDSELNLEQFSIEQIVDEAVKMMADSLELKKVTLEKNIEEGLPQVLVDGDKLRQVFLNILRNAYEAVEEGGKINLSLSYFQEDSIGKIRILISDNGSGIPAHDREVIFELFYTTKSSGIGLGLANARKIIEEHKGSIKVRDKEGEGTSFEIIIPSEEEK